MSRQGQLPPRSPFQKKSFSRPIHESYPQHHKFPSQSSILQDQPAWLDDLLSDPDGDMNATSLRRSASDPVTLMDAMVDSLSSCSNTISDEETEVGDDKKCSGLESACVFGPNSPRRRSNSTFSENAIVSALTECIPENDLQYVDHSLCVGGVTYPDLSADVSHSAGLPIAETKTAKRHSGQRSRVRKIQYIAELEQTVNNLQIFESKLSVSVAWVLQQRAAMSLENSQLKQKLARLNQEKLRMDGEYQSLKKEVEKLKAAPANPSSSWNRTYFGAHSAEKISRSDMTWQLDMRKLNLS